MLCVCALGRERGLGALTGSSRRTGYGQSIYPNSGSVKRPIVPVWTVEPWCAGWDGWCAWPGLGLVPDIRRTTGRQCLPTPAVAPDSPRTSRERASRSPGRVPRPVPCRPPVPCISVRPGAGRLPGISGRDAGISGRGDGEPEDPPKQPGTRHAMEGPRIRVNACRVRRDRLRAGRGTAGPTLARDE